MPFRAIETPHQGIAIGAGAECRAELAGEVVARQAGDFLQLGRPDHSGRLGIEELAGPGEGAAVERDRPGSPATRRVGGQERLGHGQDQPVDRERLRVDPECRLDRGCQRLVRGDRLAYEGQRAGTLANRASRLVDARRRDVDDAIAEAVRCAGAAVVCLVRV